MILLNCSLIQCFLCFQVKALPTAQGKQLEKKIFFFEKPPLLLSSLNQIKSILVCNGQFEEHLTDATVWRRFSAFPIGEKALNPPLNLPPLLLFRPIETTQLFCDMLGVANVEIFLCYTSELHHSSCETRGVWFVWLSTRVIARPLHFSAFFNAMGYANDL